ncbi:MAG: HAMP domain-containing sensor histidine kinase [Clostridia bacterium]|nr:HAMP domain-containing sensor histidine kinase [Clostridia bacterium]
MKSRTQSRLKLRFVLLSFAALALLLTFIVGFSLTRSWRQMTLKADRIILLTATNPDSPEVGDARYFVVTLQPESETCEVNLRHTALVSRPTAIEYARQVIGSSSSRGYLGSYRYLVHRGPTRTRITFLSRAVALESFRSTAETLILISIAGLAATTAALIALSGRVVAPIVKSRQTQKEFITSASHALKTPLSVISADAELLESEIGESEWLTDILKQTAHMTEMTRRLVYLARAEEQNGHAVKLDFPVSDVASELADSYRAVAQTAGKAYQTEIPEGLAYHGNEKAVRELMTVLLDNAFKYCPDGGSVSVRLKPEGRGLRFTVENTVAEIPPEEIHRFSERFYRRDASGRAQGFGIGLSVAQTVARAHRGTLAIELPEPSRIRVSATLK